MDDAHGSAHATPSDGKYIRPQLDTHTSRRVDLLMQFISSTLATHVTMTTKSGKPVSVVMVNGAMVSIPLKP